MQYVGGALCIWRGGVPAGEIALEELEVPVNGTGAADVESVFGGCSAGKWCVIVVVESCRMQVVREGE
jgi:hypothetical protein